MVSYLKLQYTYIGKVAITWQASLPACPAHIIVLSRLPAFPVCSHSERLNSGFQTYLRVLEDEPPVNKCYTNSKSIAHYINGVTYATGTMLFSEYVSG